MPNSNAMASDQSDPMGLSWRVYIVQCSDGSLYTGVAKDLDSRIARHNEGKGAKYTRSRRPVRLVYTEVAPDKGQALSRELEIKHYNRQTKLALIAKGDLG